MKKQEKAKIAKLGLEMKLITSEIEAEADKWNEPQNEIVKLAKAMSGDLKEYQNEFIQNII